MNALDLVIIIVFVPAIVSGLSKGLIRQVASIVSIVLSVWLAFKFTSALSAVLKTTLDVGDGLLDILSFVVILIAVAIAVNFLAGLAVKVIRLALLGWLDRLLGIAFAFLKAFIVAGLLLTLFNAVNDNFHIVKDEVMESSLLYKPLNEFADEVFPYLKDLLSPDAEAGGTA